MKAAERKDELISLLNFVRVNSYDEYENLTKEEIEWLDLVEEKTISKKICEDKGINISLIALQELEKIGFKRDLPAFVFSKLIEDL